MKLYVDTNGKQVTVTKDPMREASSRTAVRRPSGTRAVRCGRRRCSSWTTTAAR